VQHVLAVLRGHPRLDQAFMHRPSGGRIFAWRAAENRCHTIEAAKLLVGGQRRVIGDVVGISGESVKGVHVGSQIAPDQEGADRKILRTAPLARRGLDTVGNLLSQRGVLSRHPRYPFALNQCTASAIALRAGRGV